MPRPHRRGHLPAPLPLSPSKQTFVIAFAMSLKCYERTSEMPRRAHIRHQRNRKSGIMWSWRVPAE
jgi:hypothetical protein